MGHPDHSKEPDPVVIWRCDRRRPEPETDDANDEAQDES